MTHDVITLLRRHDPAAALRPLPEAEAGAMRDVILGSPTAAQGRRLRRRWPLAAVAAAAVALVGGATVYSSIAGDDAAPTVRRQYAAVKRTIDLPPGVHWRRLALPAELGVRASTTRSSSRSVRRSAPGTATGSPRRGPATTRASRGHTSRRCGCGG